MIFLNKILEIWYFLQMFWKDGLDKKITSEHDLFFVISGKMVFLFSRKYYIFSLGGKWKKIIFIKKRVEIWYFLYVCVGVLGVALPSRRKKTKMPPKNTPKGDISGINKKDDIHPRFALD